MFLLYKIKVGIGKKTEKGGEMDEAGRQGLGDIKNLEYK